VFCGRHLLAAKLRPSNIDGSAGAVEEVARIVAQIRARWPKTRILLRADSGFAREALMAWCEENRVDFVFGLARNALLVEEIAAELLQAETEASSTGKPVRHYKDFHYATLDSWSRRRRVIGKAEWTKGEAKPRFIVTSLSKAETNGRFLYEKVYCARGDMENRIKECQGDLFADRTSTATMRANQLRLWLASFAYVLLCAVRRIGLAHTQFAEATCGTIRLKLLKLAGLVRVSARRIKFALASAPVPTPTNGAWPQPDSPEASPRRRQIAAIHPTAHRRSETIRHYPRKQRQSAARPSHKKPRAYCRLVRSTPSMRNAG
jgi:hypothetical protein